MSASYMRRCSGKKRHDDRASAAADRASICAEAGIRTDKLSVYRCDQCLGWHVGGSAGAFISRSHNGKRANKRMRGR